MELESSQSYANFRAWCPRKEVSIGVMHPVDWRYYDWGPRDYPEPILCLHSLIGSAESFYNQIISIAPRGYRIISVQIPVYWTVAEFCDGLHNFLETIPHRRLHLYGAGLGGFLAMHYAVRKPDRVASLILTHSFLTTDLLKRPIPYSAPVLRWLPDFFIRTTYRAIFPKGRVRLDIANAAELAIGHTMLCPREELASRLALYVSDSSVVKRLHIPQTAITLIDTLDRQALALEVSQRTVSYLPKARRAFLKTGGDFPYIAVPDEVNVHLIVHLRRSAPPPVVDLPVPVPAKPMVLPLSARRRRELEEAQRRAREAQAKEENAKETAKKARRAKSSPEELRIAAREIVEADERRNIERYAFEIGRLREFLPDKGDPYLAAVLEDCAGNLDAAISNALDEQYGDTFYERAVIRAIDNAVESVKTAEEIEVIEDDIDETGDDATVEDGKRGEATGSATSGGRGPLGAPDPNHITEEKVGDLVASYRGRGLLTQDPLGETEFPSSGLRPRDGDTGGNNADDEKDTAEEDGTMAVSPGATSSEPDSESAEIRDDDPLDGLNARSVTRSGMSSVDLGVNAFYGSAEKRQMSPEKGTQSEGSQSGKKLESSSGSRRSRRSRRKSFPQTADTVDEYVSSEKVGMRSRGPLVGRGPAPFNNVTVGSGLSPGEAWVRTARPLGEYPPTTEEKANETLTSGASLLEANENPLELPRHGSQYSSDHHGREGSGSQSRASTPTFPSRKSEAHVQDSGFRLSEREVLITSEGSYLRDSSTIEQDEWERFRRRESERGLAGVISSPPCPQTVERRLDKKFEGGGTEMESEEAARLREWAMSAQAASKNVHR